MPTPSRQKVVLVTGASRGIGAATALRASRQGYSVCVNYLRNERAALTLVEAIQSSGGRAYPVQADISVEADVVRLFAACETELGRLSALVNNAGILEKQMRVENMEATRVQRILATNVVGTLLCCREAVRRMSTRHGGGGGAIVNVSSGAARLGAPNEYVDYAASKGAVDTLTIGLAREVADEGVRVNGVRPGLIDTDMHGAGGEPDRIARLQASVPMRRGGKPEEVANAICWLLSDEASYMTGAFIDVTGGR